MLLNIFFKLLLENILLEYEYFDQLFILVAELENIDDSNDALFDFESLWCLKLTKYL